MPDTSTAYSALAFAIASCTVLAPTRSTSAASSIPLGSDDLEGGSTKVGEIVPGVIHAVSPDALGTLVNEAGVAFGDMFCTIVNGTANSFELNGETASFNGGSAHVEFNDDPIAGNVEELYSIDQLAADGSEDNLEIYLTPSVETVGPGGSGTQEADLAPPYPLDRLSDSMRRGVAFAQHDALMAVVRNVDGSRAQVQIEGTISFPGSFSAGISAVRVTDSSTGAPVSGATVTIEDGRFTISGLHGRSPGTALRVVVYLDAQPQGDPVQLRLVATYEE